MTPTRQVLPDRRQSITVNTEWGGHAFTVTVGFDASGQPREVFADNAKGAMQATISDACVWASIAMQFGATPADLAKSLGRVPGWINGKEGETAASPIGAIAVAIHEAANAPRDAIGGAEMGYVDVSAVQVAEKQGGAVGRDFDGAAE